MIAKTRFHVLLQSQSCAHSTGGNPLPPLPLSLRNVEDLLHERGIEISHETVRYG
jgi:putative transposase